MAKPLERADAYVTDRVGGITWDIEGMATDLILLIKIAGFSNEAMHKKMDEIYNEVSVELADFPTEGTA